MTWNESTQRLDSPQEFGHIRALDGIRGFALILVFAYHSLLYEIESASPLSRHLRNVVIMGWAGVDLFFVLSGFLITTILLDARLAENYFKVFYARRALRILPLYYLVLIGSLLLVPGQYNLKAQIFYWLNLSNLPTAFSPFIIPYLAHFWSLGIEEQFYFVWPTVVRKMTVRSVAQTCIVIIVGLFSIRNLPVVLALNSRWPEFVYRITPLRIDTLCSGALLAIGALHWRSLGKHRAWFRVVVVCSGFLFVYSAHGRLYTAPSVIRFGYTSLIVCATSLIALALFPGSLTSRLFNNDFLCRTGKYSYCFYLTHPFLVNAVAKHRPWVDRSVQGLLGGWISHNLISLGVAAFEFGILFGICALSWTLYEQPILNFKRYFRYKPTPERLLTGT